MTLKVGKILPFGSKVKAFLSALLYEPLFGGSIFVLPASSREAIGVGAIY